MIIVSIVILTLYCVVIIAFIIGFDRVKYFNLNGSVPKTKFSIVIPFRNEAQALPVLLKSLEQLEYPTDKFELIFIDDDSKDESVEIIMKYLTSSSWNRNNISIIENLRKLGSPKKDAVDTAIAKANFDWILTTDADCKVPKDWLHLFDDFIQRYQPKLVAAPVTYYNVNSLLDQFQLLDIISLQGVTIGGFGMGKPFMCNGANLCYKKQTFLEVNGFEGNEHIASGDDMFLLEKLSIKYPDNIYYLKSYSAIIRTKSESSLKKLVSQRMRWAAKATSYKNGFSSLVSIVVFSMNIILIILFLGSFVGYYSWWLFAIVFITKFFVDIILLFKTATFFKQRSVLKHYLWSSVIYPIFIVFIALTSLTSSYSWKGRTYKK